MAVRGVPRTQGRIEQRVEQHNKKTKNVQCNFGPQDFAEVSGQHGSGIGPSTETGPKPAGKLCPELLGASLEAGAVNRDY